MGGFRVYGEGLKETRGEKSPSEVEAMRFVHIYTCVCVGVSLVSSTKTLLSLALSSAFILCRFFLMAEISCGGGSQMHFAFAKIYENGHVCVEICGVVRSLD